MFVTTQLSTFLQCAEPGLVAGWCQLHSQVKRSQLITRHNTVFNILHACTTTITVTVLQKSGPRGTSVVSNTIPSSAHVQDNALAPSMQDSKPAMQQVDNKLVPTWQGPRAAETDHGRHDTQHFRQVPLTIPDGYNNRDRDRPQARKLRNFSRSHCPAATC